MPFIRLGQNEQPVVFQVFLDYNSYTSQIARPLTHGKAFGGSVTQNIWNCLTDALGKFYSSSGNPYGILHVELPLETNSANLLMGIDQSHYATFCHLFIFILAGAGHKKNKLFSSDTI